MDLNNFKQKGIDETEEYKIISEELEYLSDFFSSLSELINFSGQIISLFVNNKNYILDTSLIESSSQTLKSIKFCCSIGSFSDANTLIRKLRDDLIQYLYILNVICIRKPFLGEVKINTENADEFSKSILNLQFNNILSDDEHAVLAWLNNDVADLKRPLRKKLEFENYITVLKQNRQISHILKEYALDEYWEILRKRLNNYVHSNGSSFSRLNNVVTNDESLEKYLKEISYRASYVSSFFLIVLLMVKSSLISSTDYIIHIDSGMEPPADSQYWVAGFIQDFIDKKVAPLHPELKQYLKDNNIHSMKIR